MKTNSSTVTRSRDPGTVAETSGRAQSEPRRGFGRTLKSMLHLGRRTAARPTPQQAPGGRVSLQRLEQFSARHEPAPGTLAYLMRADKEPTAAAPSQTGTPPPPHTSVRRPTVNATATAAPAQQARAGSSVAPPARPKTFGKLPSGPKMDYVSDTLTSIHRLGDEQVSEITQALGLGPAAAPGRAREAQLAAAGRLLRAPLDLRPALPSSSAIGRMPFGSNLPIEVMAELIQAARAVNCFVTERQTTGPDGKTVHLLQVHMSNGLDYVGQPLASQPDSPGYRDVQNLAARFAEALSPLVRTDGAQYQIEYVACGRKQGGTADVFTDHLATKMAMAQRPETVELSHEHFNQATIRTSRLFAMLPAGDREKLVRAAHVAHMIWDEQIANDANGEPQLKVRVMFSGTENMRDVKQAVSSVRGKVGKVFRATHEAAVLVAQAVEQAHEKTRNVNFEFIAGGSMGGATAQLFAAAIESRVKLHQPAPLVLFDPQLPNQAQAEHAVKDGKFEYDYAKPRGIAVTLDYAARPRKSLMGRMKGLGFKSPGLVRLKLGLSDYDGSSVSRGGGTHRRGPETSGPPGMGYHADPSMYKMALNRFTGLAGLVR